MKDVIPEMAAMPWLEVPCKCSVLICYGIWLIFAGSKCSIGWYVTSGYVTGPLVILCHWIYDVTQR